MTARRLTLSFLILAVAAVPMAAVDPALMKLVPPDATVVAGVNVEQARTTPFGQFVLKQMPLDDEGFGKMMEATGFDPRRDLREILVASKGGQPSKHSQGLVMATGSFDAARIVAAARVLGVTVTDFGRRGSQQQGIPGRRVRLSGPLADHCRRDGAGESRHRPL